ncbi:MAG: N-acetyl-gamma-glutamyl-phosphate reductase, partial [Candidatus Thermoplasmatota archaeon]
RGALPAEHRRTCATPLLNRRCILSVEESGGGRTLWKERHAFLREPLSDKDIWRLYRDAYGGEPFVRIVKDASGLYRLPEPKILSGTNFCDVGFEVDAHSDRIVVASALDNLMKGAAGSAVQSMNLMCGYPETTGLEFLGLHPV